MMNSILMIVLFGLIIFGSNVIQGITGFAGTLIAMPFLILLVDLDTAKQVLNFLGIIGSVLIIAKDFKYIQWRKLLTILIWMSVGLIVGMVTYNLAPRRILLIIFPLFVLYVGVRGLITLWRPQKETGEKHTPIKDAIILLAAGIIHGLFVAGGPLLVVYATEKLKEKHQFRATLSASWIFLNTVMLIQALVSGAITATVRYDMVLSLVPLLLGIVVGNYLLKRMNQRFFMGLSYVLLTISGVSLLF
ncbi:sulfite exporter TauE/SafE family protein [Lacticaseibacillus sp. GG6-2]